mmetsp:Transcript_3991/g.8840  ORF Transcript_3991/g.8840 Transcript_3991/m.8840 type:complete len:706 (-) Transcript_3991:269-2386(-)|eukprot:CAMPEP_0183703988 /NCGR_PEP_ID=MMETSP0737-20130205/1497_1 /TAXON_ID=385413 /ORGANISM="Thalassiosira miniscula, Strain CCMP1093" /LENGTH=705 /DNA_ID=CAMNT_0025930795 /DNA_START=201 /DNA_END=2318 /DNA_ORIENTATION=+
MPSNRSSCLALAQHDESDHIIRVNKMQHHLQALERRRAKAELIAWEQPLKPPSTALDSSGRSSEGSRTRKHFSEHESRQQQQRLLHPRRDRWLASAMVQLISTCSLASSGGTHIRMSTQRTTVEVAALTFSSLSCALSFVAGMGYSYRPFREYLLSKAPPNYYGSSLKTPQECATREQLLSLLLLVLVSIQSGLVLWPSSNNNGSYLAVAGTEIWNANLFCATWAGLYGSAYLLGTLAIGNMHGKTEKSHSMELWSFMVLFSSICTSAAMFVCYRMARPDTRDRSISLAAGLLGLASVWLSFLYGIGLRRTAKRKKNWIGLLCATSLLGMSSIIVALVSSPSSDLVHDMGSPYLSSWMAWIFSLFLWKSCMESFLVSPIMPASSSLRMVQKRGKQKHTSMRSDGTISDDGSVSETSISDIDSSSDYRDLENSDKTKQDDDTWNILPYSTSINDVESLSNGREDADRVLLIQSPLDPDGSTEITPPSQKHPWKPTHRQGTATMSNTFRFKSESHKMSKSHIPNNATDKTSYLQDRKKPQAHGHTVHDGTPHHHHHSHKNDKGRRHTEKKPHPANARPASNAANTKPTLPQPVAHDRGHSHRRNNRTGSLPSESKGIEKERKFGTPATQGQPVDENTERNPTGRVNAIDPTTVPIIIADDKQRKRVMRRRLSRDSLMSNFSPIQEASQEENTSISTTSLSKPPMQSS